MNNVYIGASIWLMSVSGTIAQSLPVKEGKVMYEAIDSTTKLSKDQLFLSARTWIANSFRSAQNVIQLEDKEAGEVIGKGYFKFYYNSFASIPNLCRFTLKVSCRDKKYRIQFYDFIIEHGRDATEYTLERINAKPNGSPNKKIIPAVDMQVIALLNDLKKSLSELKSDF